MSEPVDVVLHQEGRDVRVGRLWAHRRRETESATFRYSDEWLASAGAYTLEPALPLVAGPLRTRAGQALFGSFADSAPDRWGRALMCRSVARRALGSGETPRSPGDLDYLLGARDDTRQGALRFREDPGSPFLAPAEEGVPALLRLPALLSASERFELDEADDEDVSLLLRAGSSLGGARPKAHVLTNDGSLAIAKFPSVTADTWDVMAWEKTALDIARLAGLDTPSAALETVAGRHVLVVDRFDRLGSERVAYVSAMTMVEGSDGQASSYLEIADAITANSSAPDDDLQELWSRMVLGALISNTDDHLRNHGFLRLDGAGVASRPDLRHQSGP